MSSRRERVVKPTTVVDGEAAVRRTTVVDAATGVKPTTVVDARAPEPLAAPLEGSAQLVLPELRHLFPILNTENHGRPLTLFSGLFLHATLPHRQPESNAFTRRSQKFTLELLASPTTGLPFGRYPRLFLAWLTTVTAQIRPSREITFSGSLAAFLGALGISDSTQQRAAFIRQLLALLNTRYGIFYSGTTTTPQGKYDANQGAAFLLANEWSLWANEDPSKPSHLRVLLTEDFHEHLLSRRIPLDWTVLQGLQSPMAMDIYAALCEWSAPDRKTDLAIPWSGDPNGMDLMTRFGAEYDSPREFRRYFRQHLATVLTYYPEARVVATDSQHFVVRPYGPHVAYLNRRSRLALSAAPQTSLLDPPE